MKISSRFLRYSVRCAALVCALIGLYSCSPQTNSISIQANSTTSAQSSLDSQAIDSKNSGDFKNLASTQSTPKPKQKDTTKTPKSKPASSKDSQHKSAANTTPQENDVSSQASQDNSDTEDKPKDSQGLKFAYKDLIAQSHEGVEGGTDEGVDYNYTGVVRLYYDNGAIAWEISFKDGKQDGWTKWYYDNGQVRTQMFFVNGNANGESLWYYRHGVVREQGRYENDLANGESRLYTPKGVLKYTILYRNGREISRQEYNHKGAL